MTHPLTDEQADQIVRLTNAVFESKLPQHMHGAILRYLLDGLLPGSFLEAILTGYTQEAIGRADTINRGFIPHYIDWFRKHAPTYCYGTDERLSHWIRIGGLRGMFESENRNRITPAEDEHAEQG